MKKAQLCLWMAKGMLEAGGQSAPKVELTCFADYQIPKVHRGLGVLCYAEWLASLVDDGMLIEPDSRKEKAIRAAALIACEKIAESKGLSAPQLVLWLWLRRGEFKEPFHLVKTMKY